MRYSLHALKGEAEAALVAWREALEADGWTVSGSKSAGYRASRDDKDVAERSARVVKLADHPVCYIGVLSADVEHLRALEESGNTTFEEYSSLAKAISEGWECVEAV